MQTHTNTHTQTLKNTLTDSQSPTLKHTPIHTHTPTHTLAYKQQNVENCPKMSFLLEGIDGWGGGAGHGSLRTLNQSSSIHDFIENE